MVARELLIFFVELVFVTIIEQGFVTHLFFIVISSC